MATEPWMSWAKRIADGDAATAEQAREMASALLSRERERDSYIEAHATNIEVIKNAAKDLAAARASIEAAEKRASEAEKNAAELAVLARDVVPNLRARVTALEEVVDAARAVERGGNRYGSEFVEVPVALFHALRDRLSLLRGEQPACGTCGGSGCVRTGGGGWPGSWACPSCAAGKKEG